MYHTDNTILHIFILSNICNGMNKFNVDYDVSLFNSKFCAYQSKKGAQGNVKIFISTIYDENNDFDDFVSSIIYFTVLERICLERGFQKIKMKNRCKPCKIKKYATIMLS